MREYQLIVVIQLLMVSFGLMISFEGVFMGMTMINQLLVVIVIRISLNKKDEIIHLITFRNRRRRYFTLHIRAVFSDMEYPKNKHKHRNEDDVNGRNTNFK